MAEEVKNLPAKKEGYSPVKHGLWMAFNRSKVDGRTKLGKTMTLLRNELVKHCGGSPSITQTILIERIISKSIKCHLYETGVLSNPTGSQGSRDHYLACANSLRLDIALLGLEPKLNKIMDLDSYIKQKEENELNGKNRDSTKET